jgi:hypothetical protein
MAKENDMTYYIFKLNWSQTDSKMVIVYASSRMEAEQYLKRHGDRGPRYVDYYGEVTVITKLLPEIKI